jgi:hypothetical protein
MGCSWKGKTRILAPETGFGFLTATPSRQRWNARGNELDGFLRETDARHDNRDHWRAIVSLIVPYAQNNLALTKELSVKKVEVFSAINDAFVEYIHAQEQLTQAKDTAALTRSRWDRISTDDCRTQDTDFA